MTILEKNTIRICVQSDRYLKIGSENQSKYMKFDVFYDETSVKFKKSQFSAFYVIQEHGSGVFRPQLLSRLIRGSYEREIKNTFAR